MRTGVRSRRRPSCARSSRRCAPPAGRAWFCSSSRRADHSASRSGWSSPRIENDPEQALTARIAADALTSAAICIRGADSMRILVVEDDAEAATAMVRGLTEAGHEPTHAVDGAFGLLEAQKGGDDVYVVDRMMPRLDGIGMVETLRKDGDQTPVLFLSAMGEVDDRVAGLKAGADDYLVKPYAFSELIARVEALSRRRETGSVATMLK